MSTIKRNVYVMECQGMYKIGVSKDVEKRQKQLTKTPIPVNIIYISPQIDYAYECERNLHEIFEEKKIMGEWFLLNDYDIEAIEKFFIGMGD